MKKKKPTYLPNFSRQGRERANRSNFKCGLGQKFPNCTIGNSCYFHLFLCLIHKFSDLSFRQHGSKVLEDIEPWRSLKAALQSLRELKELMKDTMTHISKCHFSEVKNSVNVSLTKL